MHIIKYPTVWSTFPFYVKANEEGNTWTDVLDPEHATLFTSVEKAKMWMDKNLTDTASFTPTKRGEEVLKFKRSLLLGLPNRTYDTVDNSISRVCNTTNPQEIFNWWISYRKVRHIVRYEDYKTWPKLSQVFTYLNDIATYDGDKHTFSLNPKVNGGSFGRFRIELNKALPHVTRKDSDGGYMLDIFDTQWLRKLHLVVYGDKVTKETRAKIIDHNDRNLCESNDTLIKCFDCLTF